VHFYPGPVVRKLINANLGLRVEKVLKIKCYASCEVKFQSKLNGEKLSQDMLLTTGPRFLCEGRSRL